MSRYDQMTKVELIAELEAQRNSMERLEAIVDGSRDAIFISDEDSRFVSVNVAACELTGYSEEQLLGMRIPDLHEEMDLEAYNAHHAEIMDGQDALTEAEVLRGDGTKVPMEFNNRRILISGTAFMHTAARDITDRKRAEKALSHSRDLMAYVIEHNRSCVAVHDRDLNYIYVSQKYLDDYRVEERDVIGKHHYEVFPDLPQKWRDVHQKALAGEISSAEEDPFVREDGTVDWTRWECRPWYQADGSIGGIIIYTEVITERKEAQEALVRSEKSLRKAQELGHIGSWELDLRKNVLVWTDEAYRIFGVPKGTPATYETFLERVHPEDRDLINQEWLAAVAGKPYKVEHRILVDGQIKWVRQEAELTLDESGVPFRGTGFAQDITERKRAEEELKESRDRLRSLTARLDEVREEERTALARELHDDVGQNLTALRMDLSRVEMEIPAKMKPLSDSLHSMIALAQDSVDRVNRLSKELRSPILDMLGLEDAVESEVWDFQRLWGTDIGLEMDLGELEAHPARDLTIYRTLREALANIRLHAQASRIEVNLRVVGKDLVLEVLDDGIGITDRQLHAPDSYGLMGMQERAVRMGGNVTVQPRETAGTRVRTVIPVSPPGG